MTECQRVHQVAAAVFLRRRHFNGDIRGNGRRDGI